MVKRVCPFDDFEPQRKTHVGDLEILQSSHGNSNMCDVYEKTKNILFGAVQNLPNTTNDTSSSSTRPRQVQPLTNENDCQGCKSVNFLPPSQCGFCDKKFCSSCVSPCCACFQLFCRNCSTIKYNQSDDVSVCLSCYS